MLRKGVFYAFIFSLTLQFNAASQSLLQLTAVDDSCGIWTKQLLRYYALLNDSAQASMTAVILSETPVNDPYYSTSGSWGQSYDDMWGLMAIHADDAWKLATGAGVKIAVVDTGIDYNHTDIDGNMWRNEIEFNGTPGVDDDGNGYVDDINGWDFYYVDNNPNDTNGHGTHVAGIAAAEANNNEGIAGVAYDAQVMNLRVFNGFGHGIPLDAALAIRYAADMGARVINCSFGFSELWDTSSLASAVEYAYDKGCIIVVASGNDNTLIGDYPAAYEHVITVGSISPGGYRSSFSNYGSELDVMAPGFDILSLRGDGLRVGEKEYFVPANDLDAEYLRMAGTSMATPYVSGLVALLLSQCPYMTFEDILRRLTFSCVDLGAAGRDDYYGYGLVDAFNALSYDWYDTGEIKTWWTFDDISGAALKYDYQLSGEYTLIEYWPDTKDKRYEHSYGTSGEWLKTIEYYTDGVTMHKQWLPDPDPGTDGDLVSFEYDDKGRVVRSNHENNDWIITEYWDDTAGANKKYETYLDSGDVWQKTIEYYPDGTTVHRQWIADPYPAVDGDLTNFEYDDKGRIIRSNYDNNDWILTEYRDDTPGANRMYDTYLDSGDQWQKTVEYYADGVTMHRQWIADPNPGDDGDITSYEYDDKERIVRLNYDTNDWILREYRDDTPGAARRYDTYIDSSDQWVKTIEYWEDGTTMRNQWFSDSNPGTPGDVIHEEYDAGGNLILREYDDGTIAMSTLLSDDGDFAGRMEVEQGFILMPGVSMGITYTGEMAKIKAFFNR